MEQKLHLDIEGDSKSRGVTDLGKTVLVLSLLLSVCVATVIYMSIHVASQATPTTVQQWAVKDQAHLNIRDDEQTKVEDVEYNEDDNMAFFYGSDGYFQAEDFEKGLQIVKDVDDGHCYVIPVGTNQTAGGALKNFIKSYAGEEIELSSEKSYKVNLLPGAIENTSFLPSEADAECSAYHWMSIVGEDADVKSELSREKRNDPEIKKIKVRYDADGNIKKIKVVYR